MESEDRAVIGALIAVYAHRRPDKSILRAYFWAGVVVGATIAAIAVSIANAL